MRRNLHVTKSHHANRLPETQPSSRNHTTVQALQPVVLVNVLGSGGDRHLLWSVGVFRLALHLDPNHLDRLIPGTQTSSDSTREDLLPGIQLDIVSLPTDFANGLLRQTRQSKARTPVRHLANGNRVHTPVDAAYALLAVDLHERGHRAGRLDARRCQLGLGDLDGLHAGAEAHGGVRLRDTTEDTAGNPRRKVAGAESAGVVFTLGSNEKEDGALGRSFDPGPGDQALVDCSPTPVRQLRVASAGPCGTDGRVLGREELTPKNTTAAPDCRQRASEAYRSVCRHRRLRDLERLAQGSYFEPAIA